MNNPVNLALLRLENCRFCEDKNSFVKSFVILKCLRYFDIFVIRITCPCDLYPLAPQFYTVILGFTAVYIRLLNFALKHGLWVLVSNVGSTFALIFAKKLVHLSAFSKYTFACIFSQCAH